MCTLFFSIAESNTLWAQRDKTKAIQIKETQQTLMTNRENPFGKHNLKLLINRLERYFIGIWWRKKIVNFWLRPIQQKWRWGACGHEQIKQLWSNTESMEVTSLQSKCVCVFEHSSIGACTLFVLRCYSGDGGKHIEIGTIIILSRPQSARNSITCGICINESNWCRTASILHLLVFSIS